MNKSSKYDRIKKSKSFNVFGYNISFDYYTFDEYIEVQKSNTKDELINISKIDATNYFQNEILPFATNASLIDIAYNITEEQGKIIVVAKYTVNERIGEFIKKNE